MNQPPAAAGGPAEADEPRTDISSAYRPLPSRRVLRAAEREAEKKDAKSAAHRASQLTARPASLTGRRNPITGAIPAVPARTIQEPRAASGNRSNNIALPGRAGQSSATDSSSTVDSSSAADTNSPERQGSAVFGAQPDAVRAAVPGLPYSTSAAAAALNPAALLELPEQIVAPAGKVSRAGRNLPAAILVGAALLVTVLIGLLFYPPAFAAMVILASALGVWEVSRALLQRGVVVPIVPIMFSVVAMPVVGYYVGAEGLLFALVACALAVMIWRSLDEAPGTGQSIFAGVFLIAWIPFMISFVLLLMRASDGPASAFEFRGGWPEIGALKVITIFLLVVANDTFGYLFGSLFGKHPMAPKISPKKSWEGFFGSVLGAVLIGILASVFLLQETWWVGAVLAVGIVIAATTGDFAESMIKRELGVKDMSSILPGHGGLMDRLDSILFAAPAAFMLFSAFDWLQGL